MRKVAFKVMIPAVKLPTSLLAVAFLIAACGGNGSTARTSPSAASATTSKSPTGEAPATPAVTPPASPTPLTGSFAVLATATSADTYTVSIVGTDAKVFGAAQASSPAAVTCGNGAAALVPLPISTSDYRAYYMDAQGVVRFLTVQGETGRATTVPVGGGRRSMFAVSPDDQRIAVVVNDYTASGVSLKLYVEDLNGGTNHVDIFSSSGAFGLWPVGWHGTNNLVLAKVPACVAGQGCGPFSCGPRELHVVDPATAVRRFTIGGPTCLLVGSPSPAGVVCESTSFTQASIVNWIAQTVRSFAIQGPTPAYLSPDGNLVALTQFSNGTTTFAGGGKTVNLTACGWMDSTHVIAGGDIQQQPRIGDVTSGKVIPVAAQGTCAGRLPGGL